jgi:thioredoxin 1
MATNVTTDNFTQEVMESKTPVLVDFWAPWCGPCQMLTPHLETLSESYRDKIKVCKLNVDEAPEVATQFSVMSIPALFIFKDGNIAEKRVGAMNLSDLEKFIQPYV